MKRLVVTGGGTGGHVTPALALALAFLEADASRKVLYIGSKTGLEARAAPATGLPFKGIPARGFRGKSVTGKILFLSTLLRGFLVARRALNRFKPDAILATGSYVSLPVILAARLTGLPIFLQEQNRQSAQAGLRIFHPEDGRWTCEHPRDRRQPGRSHALQGGRGSFAAFG